MYTKRRLLMFGSCLLAATVPGTLHAQTVNPTTAQFLASADHNTTTSDGTPTVGRYELDFYLAGAAQPFRVLSLGKPTPNGSNSITINLSTLFGGALPPAGIVYESRVLAIGPGGSGASNVSNTFEYSMPCSFAVSPSSPSIGRSGGPASVTVTTTTGCVWTATSNSSWLTVTSGASGSGSATTSYTSAPNTSTPPRSGTLTVAGQTVTVTEAGGPLATPRNVHILRGQ